MGFLDSLWGGIQKASLENTYQQWRKVKSLSYSRREELIKRDQFDQITLFCILLERAPLNIGRLNTSKRDFLWKLEHLEKQLELETRSDAEEMRDNIQRVKSSDYINLLTFERLD